MCTTCDTCDDYQLKVETVPQFDLTSKQLTVLTTSIITDMDLTWYSAFRVEPGDIAATLTPDNELSVKLRYTANNLLPKAKILTPIVHTFNLTLAELQSRGVNNTTKLKLTYELDGIPQLFVVKDCWPNYFTGGEICRWRRMSTNVIDLR